MGNAQGGPWGNHSPCQKGNHSPYLSRQDGILNPSTWHADMEKGLRQKSYNKGIYITYYKTVG